MGLKSLGKGILRNLGEAHKVSGIGRAYARRAVVGASIGAVAGGTIEATQGGSFGEGAVSGATKGALIGAGTVAYKAAGLGKEVFREGTTRLGKVNSKGRVFRNMWRDTNVANKTLDKPGRQINASKAKLKRGMSVNQRNLAEAGENISKSKYKLKKDMHIGGNHTVTTVDMNGARKNIRGNSRVKNALQQIDNNSAVYDPKTRGYLLADGTMGKLYPNEAKYIHQANVIPR